MPRNRSLLQFIFDEEARGRDVSGESDPRRVAWTRRPQARIVDFEARKRGMRPLRFTLKELLALPAVIGVLLYAFLSGSVISFLLILTVTVATSYIAVYVALRSKSLVRIYFAAFAFVGWTGVIITLSSARHPISDVHLLQSIWWHVQRGGSWSSLFGSCVIANFYLLATVVLATLTGFFAVLCAHLSRRE